MQVFAGAITVVHDESAGIVSIEVSHMMPRDPCAVSDDCHMISTFPVGC